MFDFIQQAYKNSCKLTGYQFNHNDDYTGRAVKVDYSSPNYREAYQFNSSLELFSDYQNSGITEDAVATLLLHGLKLDENLVTEELDLDVYEPEQLAVLILEFCKLTLPDLKYKEIAVKMSEIKGTSFPAFNGWWNPELNQQIGYSLYE